MRNHLTRQDVTPKLIEAGYAYIAAKAATKVIAATVNPIQVNILQAFEFYNDLEAKHGLPRQRITDPKDLYLSENEEGIQAYYAAVDQRLKAEGIKPQDMDSDHCPVLVAESEQHEAEYVLITEAARMMEVDEPEDFSNKLLCQRNGLEKRQEFIDLVAALVVNL